MLSNVSNDSLPYGVMSYFIFLITSLIFPDRYANMATGLAPESVQARRTLEPTKKSAYYLLRPETVESFYILYTITGDPIYREWGWEIFQSIEKYCKTEIAYTSYKDVSNTDTSENPNNDMESFFLAETLKYMYLLFDNDSEIDILNTVRF
jgi:mannosyl-oligosaccharide alpha-1,2-mannosidase